MLHALLGQLYRQKYSTVPNICVCDFSISIPCGHHAATPRRERVTGRMEQSVADVVHVKAIKHAPLVSRVRLGDDSRRKSAVCPGALPNNGMFTNQQTTTGTSLQPSRRA